MEIKSRIYQCGLCKQFCESAWSEEEALKEMEEIWGNIPEADRAVMCDDCFNLHQAEIAEYSKQYKK